MVRLLSGTLTSAVDVLVDGEVTGRVCSLKLAVAVSVKRSGSGEDADGVVGPS